MADQSSCKPRAGRLEQILDRIAAFVVVMDADGRMVEINSDTVAAGGSARNDLIGTTFWEAPWWGDDRDVRQSLHLAVLAAARGSTIQLEAVAYDMAGARLPVLLKIAPLCDETGAVSEIIASGADMTRERQLQRDALQAQARLRRLLDTLPAAAMILEGGDHVVAYANPVCRRYLGDRRITGRSLRDAAPELPGALFANLDRVFAGGAADVEPELVVPGFDDAVFYCALLPWFLDTGSVGGVIAFGYDITERIRARSELEQSRSELRAVLDRTLALVTVIGPDGRVVDVNAAAATVFGLDRESVEGEPFSTALWSPDGESSALVADAAAVALSGQGVRFDVEFQTPDGRTGVLDLMLAPQLEADGSVRRVIASAFDITDRKEAAERIDTLLQEVNHRSKNLLGLVQAVARQTRGEDLADYRRKFQQRLSGLSAAQDLVTSRDWGEVELDALIANALGASCGALGDRVRLNGPRDVTVSARAAQSLGMTIHELAANAARYGALSNGDGVVAISWRCEPGGLFISWVESGGPAVAPPATTGFGTLVIDTVVAEALGGAVTLDYAPEGLRWSLTGAAASARAVNA